MGGNGWGGSGVWGGPKWIVRRFGIDLEIKLDGRSERPDGGRRQVGVAQRLGRLGGFGSPLWGRPAAHRRKPDLIFGRLARRVVFAGAIRADFRDGVDPLADPIDGAPGAGSRRLAVEFLGETRSPK